MKKSDKERLELEKRCLISLLEEVAEQYSDDGSIRVIGLEPEMRRVKLDLVVTVEDRAGLEELLEKGARKIRKGLYFIRENALIPIYLLISDEVEGESERERRLFKEYSRLCSERGSRGA